VFAAPSRLALGAAITLNGDDYSLREQSYRYKLIPGTEYTFLIYAPAIPVLGLHFLNGDKVAGSAMNAGGILAITCRVPLPTDKEVKNACPADSSRRPANPGDQEFQLRLLGLVPVGDALVHEAINFHFRVYAWVSRPAS
jgi:hypothetical protein